MESEISKQTIDKAIVIAKECVGRNNFNVSLLQRKFKKGYVWAAKLMEELENRKIVGPYNGKGYREVL